MMGGRGEIPNSLLFPSSIMDAGGQGRWAFLWSVPAWHDNLGRNLEYHSHSFRVLPCLHGSHAKELIFFFFGRMHDLATSLTMRMLRVILPVLLDQCYICYSHSQV